MSETIEERFERLEKVLTTIVEDHNNIVREFNEEESERRRESCRSQEKMQDDLVSVARQTNENNEQWEKTRTKRYNEGRELHKEEVTQLTRIADALEGKGELSKPALDNKPQQKRHEICMLPGSPLFCCKKGRTLNGEWHCNDFRCDSNSGHSKHQPKLDKPDNDET